MYLFFFPKVFLNAKNMVAQNMVSGQVTPVSYDSGHTNIQLGPLRIVGLVWPVKHVAPATRWDRV